MDSVSQDHQKDASSVSINQEIDNILANSYVQAVRGNAKEARSSSSSDSKNQPQTGKTNGGSADVTPNTKEQSVDQSNTVNSTANHDANRHGEGLFIREFEGSKGGPLTSTKAPESYHDSLELDSKEYRRSKTPQDDIVSGREAGSNWHRSA